MPPSGHSAPPAPPDLAPIDCETAVRRLWDYLDGELAVRPRGEVEAHLRACERCPPHFAFSTRVKRALRGVAAPVPRADEEAALRRRVGAALAALAADGRSPRR